MAVSSVSSAAMAEETEGKKYEVVENAGGFNQVIQEGGKKLSYSPESGVTLLEDDGFLLGSGPHHIDIDLLGEDDNKNPKYGILTVKHYLQQAGFDKATTIELAGTPVGIFE